MKAESGRVTVNHPEGVHSQSPRGLRGAGFHPGPRNFRRLWAGPKGKRSNVPRHVPGTVTGRSPRPFPFGSSVL